MAIVSSRMPYGAGIVVHEFDILDLVLEKASDAKVRLTLGGSTGCFVQDGGEDEDEDEDIGRKRHSPFCAWIHPSLVVTGHQTPSRGSAKRPLPPILWGSNKSCPNPARDSALQLTTEQEAHRLVEQDYGDLIKILFCKCRDLKRAPSSIWQTNYGKKTTAMASLGHVNPNIHRTFSLQAYLTKKFQFIAYVNQRREQDHACDQALHLNRPTL
ncbi:MAG: hypothetical protein J3R72DRAFT_490821 [Linnemannia gamsii]|nr:MAG: hypothetical protein J3R72DRAFT_490821 [Linnemannia gamsii]